MNKSTFSGKDLAKLLDLFWERGFASGLRIGQGEGWDEGAATALEHAIRNEDGVTLRLEHQDGQTWQNPYRRYREASK